MTMFESQCHWRAYRLGPLHWILPSLFGMDFGGRKNCATVGSFLSTMACTCSMFYNFGAGRYVADDTRDLFAMITTKVVYTAAVFCKSFLSLYTPATL
jgi:hypothetical protein